MDVVTQLQTKVDLMSAIYKDAIGVVQRDAPPQPLAGEALVGSAAVQAKDAPDMPAMVAEIAKVIVRETQAIDALVDELPGLDSTEDEQLDALEAAERENEKVEALLRDVLGDAERCLTHLRAALVDFGEYSATMA